MKKLTYIGILLVIFGLTCFKIFQLRDGSSLRSDGAEPNNVSLSSRAVTGMGGRNRPVEDVELSAESYESVFEFGNVLVKYLEQTGNYGEVLAALRNEEDENVEMLLRTFVFGIDSGYGVAGDLEKQLELANDLNKNDVKFLGRALMTYGEKRGKEAMIGEVFESLRPIHQLNLVTGMTRGGVSEAIVGTLKGLSGKSSEDIKNRIVSLMIIKSPVEFVGAVDQIEPGPFKDTLLITVVRGLADKSANEEAEEWLGEIGDFEMREELRNKLNIGK